MAGEEIHPSHFSGAHAGDILHEVHGFDHAMRHAVILVGESGMLGEIEVPVLGMVEVGEPAFDQGADKIQGQGRAFVGAQQKLRIGPAVAAE